MDGQGKTQYNASVSLGGTEPVLMDMNGNEAYLGLGVTGMTPGRGFSMGDASENFGMSPAGWQGMQGPTGMTPVPVLRSLASMEPLNAMDLTLDRPDDGTGEPQYTYR